MQDGVHRLQDTCDAELVRRVPPSIRSRSDQFRGEGTVESRRRAFARYVADRDDEAVRFRIDEVVKIASQFMGGGKSPGDIRVAQAPRWFGRQQRRLNALREAQLFHDTLFVAPNL